MARSRKSVKKQSLVQFDPLTGWEDVHLPYRSFQSLPQRPALPLLPLQPHRFLKLKSMHPLSPVTCINIGQPIGSPLRSKLRMGIHRNAILSAAATLADCRAQLTALQKRLSKGTSLISSDWESPLFRVQKRNGR